MLTQFELVTYLLERQFIYAETLVDGDLTVADISRRNSNFKVISEVGPCYLVKQGRGHAGIDWVHREAAVYELLHATPQRDALGRYIPRYYGYDPNARLLILELLHGDDLRQHHLRRRRFSRRLAAQLGTALGLLHQTMGAEPGLRSLGHHSPAQPAWALSVHQPNVRVFRDSSSAQLQMVKLIQGTPAFCQVLDELRVGWHAETLIHFDIKWDNIIVNSHPGARRNGAIKLVDWESAGLGDPWWDVGSVFSNYLSCWLLSIPITGEAPPERFVDLAQFPLEPMQPALRAFWQAYVRQTGLDRRAAHACLLRAVKYAAARLVQTGSEHVQAMAVLPGNIVCLLQLSLNVLLRPLEAAVQLLGISPGV